MNAAPRDNGAARRAQVREQHNLGWCVLLDGAPVAIENGRSPYYQSREDVASVLQARGAKIDAMGWVQEPSARPTRDWPHSRKDEWRRAR